MKLAHEAGHRGATAFTGTAVDAITHAASDVKYRVKEGQFRTQQVVREHPLVSVGLALSAGVLLGAIGHRLLEHKQTLGEALADSLGVKGREARVRRLI